MQSLWPWVLLGLFPYEVVRQQEHGKRSLTVHALYWSLTLCRRQIKRGQEEHCT
jgi:hypothetical protein